MALMQSVGYGPGAGAVYFERFAPTMKSDRPAVVMIHGACHSGSCYQWTPDGRPGWVQRFVDRGYPVIVPDWPGIARSGYIPLDEMTGERMVEGLSALIASLDAPVAVITHSMSGCFGWRLLELHGDRIAAVVGVAPSPPGNIQPVAPVSEETETAIETQKDGLHLRIEKGVARSERPEVIDHILVGTGDRFPREHLELYRSTLLAVPPRLLIERLNIGGSQVRVSDPRRLTDSRILVVTGTHDQGHSREHDEAIVDWLRAQGAHADFCYLGDRGIVGNGHMMMLENNSEQIADVIVDWLDDACA